MQSAHILSLKLRLWIPYQSLVDIHISADYTVQTIARYIDAIRDSLHYAERHQSMS